VLFDFSRAANSRHPNDSTVYNKGTESLELVARIKNREFDLGNQDLPITLYISPILLKYATIFPSRGGCCYGASRLV